jgi:hypothetical protein
MPLEVTKFRLFEKNTLRGFATVRLTGVNLEIRDITIHEKNGNRDITIHEKNGNRWVSLPSKPYESDGETKYSYIVKFYEKPTWERFQAEVLKQIAKLAPQPVGQLPDESDDLSF